MFSQHHIALLEKAKDLLISDEETYICHAIKHADIGEYSYTQNTLFSDDARNLLDYVREELDCLPTLSSYLIEIYDLYHSKYLQDMRICWIDRIIYLINEKRI